MVQRNSLSLDVAWGTLESIPREGPLLVIANHPYGILDGLMMGHILSGTRGDFRILANSMFRKAEDLNRVILPISFDDTRDARQFNFDNHRIALDCLSQGGAIGIFPCGEFGTAARPFSKPMDPGWRSFKARMIAKPGAMVVPIYSDGHTSRLFQTASHMHATWRMGPPIKEFGERPGTRVRVFIQTPIRSKVLVSLSGDSKAMMDFLRKATYELSAGPTKRFDLGHEFETRRRA